MQASIPDTELSLHTWLLIASGQPVATRKSREGHVVGDFATESLLLCADLAKAIVEAAESELLRDFSSMTIISRMFQSGDGKAGLGVAILSSMPAPEDFRQIAKDVLSRVSPQDRHLAQRDGSLAQQHADEFLARHGGKSIPTTLVASIGHVRTELCGRLPSQAQRPEIKQQISEIDGKVDGILKKRRTLFIEVPKGKSLSCKYDEEKFFDVLVTALRESKSCRFEIAVENDGNDKPQLVLKKIELTDNGWGF